MLHNRIGDALKAFNDGEIKVLAHGVNCSGGFGSGIAGQIAKQYPRVKEYFHNRKFDLGDIQAVHIEDGKWIVNCATQQRYGSNPNSEPNGMYCSYQAITNCMHELKKTFPSAPIGIPHIGAGLAGGEWKYIRSLITEVFAEDANIYAYKFKMNDSEIEVIKDILSFFEPTGFHSYHEQLSDAWKGFKEFSTGKRHIWFSLNHKEEYVEVCRIRFYKETTKGDLLSILGKIY